MFVKTSIQKYAAKQFQIQKKKSLEMESQTAKE